MARDGERGEAGGETMIEEPEKLTTRFWHVYISLPKEEGKHYRRNKTLGVVAVDLHTAVAEALKHYPNSTVWTVNHRGIVDHVVMDIGNDYHIEDYPKGVKY